MTIKITECEATSTGLFADLAAYDTVDAWLKAIDANQAQVWPHCLAVKVGEKVYYWGVGIQESSVTSMDKIVRAVRQLPKQKRAIPNDTLKIDADVFEQRLAIIFE